MSSKRLKRITNEIKELHESKQLLENSGIHFHINENDMTKIYALLIGPEKTPYEKGYYLFKFTYPENYPMEPPIAKYCTQGSLGISPVRFNPNLYTDGKVCLSMLNTWSGPGWVPTNTMCNVLVAIQALVLNEEPLKNEPGFEFAQKTETLKYNRIIEYANIQISIFEMIKNTPNDFIPFKHIMVETFIKNIDYFRAFLSSQILYLNNIFVQSPAYSLRIKLQYHDLLNYLEKFFQEIMSEKEINNIQNIKI